LVRPIDHSLNRGNTLSVDGCIGAAVILTRRGFSDFCRRDLVHMPAVEMVKHSQQKPIIPAIIKIAFYGLGPR